MVCLEQEVMKAEAVWRDSGLQGCEKVTLLFQRGSARANQTSPPVLQRWLSAALWTRRGSAEAASAVATGPSQAAPPLACFPLCGLYGSHFPVSLHVLFLLKTGHFRKSITATPLSRPPADLYSDFEQSQHGGPSQHLQNLHCSESCEAGGGDSGPI